MMDEEAAVNWLVEQTEMLEEQMPAIEMMMATALAKRMGSSTVDMKLAKDFCEDCTLDTGEGYKIPHYHLVGTVR